MAEREGNGATWSVAMAIDPEELERRFGELLAADLNGRAASLRALHGESPELARRLAVLLDACEATLDPVDAMREATLRRVSAFDAEALIGRQLGDWTLSALIGRGGMGVVYEARREREGIEEQAAIKLLSAPLFDGRAADRFVAEARALARLDHPGICRLRDWGRSPEGWPYLVLDLVRGAPLPVETSDRPLRQRVETMARIADAVAAAHRQLVAHLDLKPANVLITPDGRPVLLDFGISRVLNDDADAGATLTRWMTPRYASPEQLRGEAATAASDIHSLGAMLYEQISGKPPFEIDGASVTESLRRIEQGAIPPSRIGAGISRDFDAICARAMHPDAQRRYASADAFAEDLRAVLDRRPVSARPDSALYRVSRLIARHPVATSIIALAVLAVVSLAVLLALQANDLRRQRDRAELAAQRAESATGLLLDSIQSADPTGEAGASTTLADLMAATEKRISTELSGQSGARAQALGQLAQVHRNVGDPERAVDLYRQALTAFEQAGDESDEDLQVALVSGLASSLRQTERTDDALALLDAHIVSAPAPAPWKLFQERGALHLAQGRLDDGLSDLQRALVDVPTDDPNRSAILSNIGNAYGSKGDYPESLRWEERAVAAAEASHPVNREQLAVSLSNMGDSLSKLGRTDDALAAVRRALALRIEMFGERHVKTIPSYIVLAFVLIEAGRWDEALETGQHAAELEQALTGGDTRRMLNIRNAIGLAAERKGDAKRAREGFAEARRIALALLPANHPAVAGIDNNLASTMMGQGDYAAALEPLQHAYETYRANSGDSPSRGRAIAGINMAESLLKLGREKEALRWSVEAVAEAERVFAPEQWLLANIRNVHAEILLANGSRLEAEQEALGVERIYAASAVAVPDRPRRDNLDLLRRIYEELGATDKAAAYAGRIDAMNPAAGE